MDYCHGTLLGKGRHEQPDETLLVPEKNHVHLGRHLRIANKQLEHSEHVQTDGQRPIPKQIHVGLQELLIANV